MIGDRLLPLRSLGAKPAPWRGRSRAGLTPQTPLLPQGAAMWPGLCQERVQTLQLDVQRFAKRATTQEHVFARGSGGAGLAAERNERTLIRRK